MIKLVTTYERGVYGNEHMQTTNGYESRRQSALAEGVSARLKAGAAASALALVATKLAPVNPPMALSSSRATGESSAPERYRSTPAAKLFEFPSDGEPATK